MKKKANTQSDLDKVYKKILGYTCLLIMTLGIPILISSFSRYIYTGFKWIYVYQLMAEVILIIIYFLRNKVNYKILAWVLIVLFMFMTLPSVLTFGLEGKWEMGIFLITFIASVFFGKRAGIAIVIFGFLYGTITYYLYIIGPRISDISEIALEKYLSFVIFDILQVTFISLLVVFIIDKYRNYFENTFLELTSAKDEIQINEKKYKFFADNTFEGILLHKNGIVADVNVAFEKLTGYTRQELIGKNIFELVLPEKYKSVVPENIKKHIADPYEIEIIKKDGTRIPVEIVAKNITSPSGKTIRTTAVRDITPRKKAEEAARKEQIINKSIIESLPSIFYIYKFTSGGAKLVKWNDSYKDLLGYTDEDLHQMYAYDFFLPEDYDKVEEKLTEIQNGGRVQLEIKVLLKNGNTIPVLLSVTGFRLNNENYFTGIGMDISELKDYQNQLVKKNYELAASEEELRTGSEQLKETLLKLEESEKLYRGIFDNLMGGYYKTDANGNIVLASPSAFKITGFNKEEIMGKPAASFYVNPEERETFLKKIKKEGKVEGYRALFRTRHRGNIYIYTNSKLIFNDKGEYDGVEGIFYDITTQVNAENKLKQLSTAIEQSANVVVITDTKGRIEYTNPSFTALTGYTAEEVLGQNPMILNAGVQPKSYYKEMWKTITQGKTWKGEFCNKTKQGRIFWENVVISPIKDNEGNITNFLAVKEDITHKKKAEETELKFDIFTKKVTEGISIVDEWGNQLFVNPAFAKITGYSVDELLKMKAKDLTDKRNMSSEEYKKFFMPKIMSIPENYEIILYHKTGRKVYVEVNVAPIILNNKKVALATFHDVTQRIEKERELKREREKLQLSNERLESLFKISQYYNKSIQDLFAFALNEAIRLTNSEIGFFMYYNEETRELTLNSWSQGVMEACKVEGEQNIFELDKTGLWGEPIRQQKPVVINDYGANHPAKKGIPAGHLKISKYLGVPVFSDGKVVAITAVANKASDYDETDIRQITLLMNEAWKISEKYKIMQDLKIAKEKAEESDRLKSAFLASMSHEIRTPLNAIVGFSNIIADSSVDPHLADFADIVNKQNELLLQLVNDILDFSKFEAGAVIMHNQPFDINSIIDEVFTLFKSKCPSSIKLVPTKLDNPVVVNSDQMRLKQVIINLISNALKFTQEGEITFGFELNSNSEIIGFVKDTGKGIPPEKQNLIFERFTKLDKFTQGTGLGLAIVKTIIDNMNGEIWLESEFGKGSCFYFKIPFETVVPRNFLRKSKPPADKKNSTTAGSGATILIAEDNESNFFYLKELLKKYDITIIHAYNGRDAVEICKTNGDISLVLMDIKMPVLNGYEATKQIKNIIPQLPVIAQTAYASNSDKDKALEAGCDDYVAKPIKKEALIKMLEKFLIKK